MVCAALKITQSNQAIMIVNSGPARTPKLGTPHTTRYTNSGPPSTTHVLCYLVVIFNSFSCTLLTTRQPVIFKVFCFYYLHTADFAVIIFSAHHSIILQIILNTVHKLKSSNPNLKGRFTFFRCR